MSITVIIPARNEEEILPKLLQSIYKQTDSIDEIIVVDSHSTDNTATVAKAFASKLPLRVHTAQEKGVAAARNEAAALAKSDYLLFIDSDVTLPKYFIADFKKALRIKHLDMGGFTQRMESKKLGLRFGAQAMNLYARTMSHTPWPIMFSCMFAKRAIHQRINGFDPEIYLMEDYDYALRGHRAGARFGIITSTFFNASPRRYETDDGLASIFRGFYGEFYRYTHGMRVTKPIYEYKMGGKEKKK